MTKGVHVHVFLAKADLSPGVSNVRFWVQMQTSTRLISDWPLLAAGSIGRRNTLIF
jgi:hypothetical protein